MATAVYLITLSGQGDTHIKLVDKETFDWMTDGGTLPAAVAERFYTDNQSYYPQNTREEIIQMLEECGDDSSSPANDRALNLPGMIYDNYGGSVRELNKFLKDNDMEIADEYEGYIY